jgi:hypothetical protein
MNLDEKMTKIKFVHLDEVYKFLVYDFSIWNLPSQNLVRRFHILKVKFWIVQTKSDGEMSNTKVIDIDEVYN